jgi:hypothetical protein
VIHDQDITKWPDATFAKWLALIDQTPAFEWHHKVVDPAMVAAHNAKLAAASLASASAARAKS